jgi:hypothetical protein
MGNVGGKLEFSVGAVAGYGWCGVVCCGVEGVHCAVLDGRGRNVNHAAEQFLPPCFFEKFCSSSFIVLIKPSTTILDQLLARVRDRVR